MTLQIPEASLVQICHQSFTHVLLHTNWSREHRELLGCSLARGLITSSSPRWNRRAWTGEISLLVASWAHDLLTEDLRVYHDYRFITSWSHGFRKSVFEEHRERERERHVFPGPVRIFSRRSLFHRLFWCASSTRWGLRLITMVSWCNLLQCE